MRVRIKGVDYNSEETPILIELSKSDKKNIENMHEDKFKYICFSDKLDWNKAKEILFIDDKGNNIEPDINQIEIKEYYELGN